MAQAREQMGCCLCCGAPFEPSRTSLGLDRVASRSIIYIDRDAADHRRQWSIDPNSQLSLLSQRESLHMFHRSNVLPVIRAFTSANGKLRDLYANTDAPAYNAALFNQIAGTVKITAARNQTTGVVPAAMYIVGTNREQGVVAVPNPVPPAGGWGGGDPVTAAQPYPARPANEDIIAAVTWRRPAHIAGFDPLLTLIRNCVTRSTGIRGPLPEMTVQGCRNCNNIMTQQATSAHFLVRLDISPAPLVPDDAIFRHNVYGPQNLLRFAAHYRLDPSDDTRGGRNHVFTYEACVAYFIHRCLPTQTRVVATAQERWVRNITVACSFAVLTIACLFSERYNGSQGGTEPNPKPGYYYRGCTEMYLAYVIWLLTINDNPEGVPNGLNQRRCTMEFHRFHRYFFTEVHDSLMISDPQLSDTFEIGDVVFGPYQHNNPEVVIGDLAQRIANFYINIFKPLFSRHLANLEPNPALMVPNFVLYSKQKHVVNMLVSPNNLNVILHMVERCVVGDIDDFINSVGVRAVTAVWRRLLNVCPERTKQLVAKMVDALVMQEYLHIMRFGQNPWTPKMDEATAEKIYILCNALGAPDEDGREDVEDLRQVPLCSPFQAVLRLENAGAFVEEVDV